MIKEILYPPFKSVFLRNDFTYEFKFRVVAKQMETPLTFTPGNVPVLVMLNQASGNLIYSFGFDFSKIKKESVMANKGESSKFESILVRKSYVNSQTKVVVNIKNIFGLSKTMDNGNEESVLGRRSSNQKVFGVLSDLYDRKAQRADRAVHPLVPV